MEDDDGKNAETSSAQERPTSNHDRLRVRLRPFPVRVLVCPKARPWPSPRVRLLSSGDQPRAGNGAAFQ